MVEFDCLQAGLQTTSLGKYREIKDSERNTSFKVSTGGPASSSMEGGASSSAGGPSVVRDVIIKEQDSDEDNWNYNLPTKPTGKLAVNLEQLKKKKDEKKKDDAPSGRGGAARRSNRKDAFKSGFLFFLQYDFDSTKGYPGEGPSKL